MAQQRQQAGHLLLLDTGDALVGSGPLGTKTHGEAIVAAMNLMGYDAMALGPKELSLGADLLRQRMEEADFAILSANAVLSGTEELVADPYVILEVEGHPLAIIGLTRPPGEPLADFQVQEPEAALARAISELGGRADTIILLTNLNYRRSLALADAVPGVDLVIAALPDQLPAAAVRATETGTLVVAADQSMPRHSGRRVGRLVVTVEPDGSLSGESWASVPMDKRFADDPTMRDLLNRYRH